MVWLTVVVAGWIALNLSTQRRDDELASYREQLTLELAILGEQKSAKIIELLEELRRDDPTIRDRIDHDAAAMSAPADPQAVLDAIKDSHAGMEEPGVEASSPVESKRVDEFANMSDEGLERYVYGSKELDS
jgi:hypothetical protein